MSLASPNTNNTSSLFVNPIQDKIDASTNLNKLIEKNGKKIFTIFNLLIKIFRKGKNDQKKFSSA